MAILWRSTSKSKTNSYKGYIPMPSTIDEPSFAEKWKRWRQGNPAKFLKYTDLQELVYYCYQNNMMTTVSDLEYKFHEHGITDKENAIKYINEHKQEFSQFDEYTGRPSRRENNNSNNNTNNDCCYCCKKKP